MSRQRKFKWEDLPEAEQQQYFETELPPVVQAPPPTPPRQRPKREIFTLTEANLDEGVEWVRHWNRDTLRFLRGVLREEPGHMPRVFKVTSGDGGKWLDLITIDGISIYWYPGETYRYVHLGEFEKVVTYGLSDRRRQDLTAEDAAKLTVLGWET